MDVREMKAFLPSGAQEVVVAHNPDEVSFTMPAHSRDIFVQSSSGSQKIAVHIPELRMRWVYDGRDFKIHESNGSGDLMSRMCYAYMCGNVGSGGSVCWGPIGTPIPRTPREAWVAFWGAPFNTDLMSSDHRGRLEEEEEAEYAMRFGEWLDWRREFYEDAPGNPAWWMYGYSTPWPWHWADRAIRHIERARYDLRGCGADPMPDGCPTWLLRALAKREKILTRARLRMQRVLGQAGLEDDINLDRYRPIGHIEQREREVRRSLALSVRRNKAMIQAESGGPPIPDSEGLSRLSQMKWFYDTEAQRRNRRAELKVQSINRRAVRELSEATSELIDQMTYLRQVVSEWARFYSRVHISPDHNSEVYAGSLHHYESDSLCKMIDVSPILGECSPSEWLELRAVLRAWGRSVAPQPSYLHEMHERYCEDVRSSGREGGGLADLWEEGDFGMGNDESEVYLMGHLYEEDREAYVCDAPPTYMLYGSGDSLCGANRDLAGWGEAREDAHISDMDGPPELVHAAVWEVAPTRILLREGNALYLGSVIQDASGRAVIWGLVIKGIEQGDQAV